MDWRLLSRNTRHSPGQFIDTFTSAAWPKLWVILHVLVNIICFANSQTYCPLGQTALMIGSQALPCNLAMGFGCPTGYTCFPDTGYCCNLLTAADAPSFAPSCPGGGNPYFLGATSPSCYVGQYSTCPIGYQCLAAPGQQRGFCCTVNCPVGSWAYTINTVAQTCNIGGSSNQCTAGYVCRGSDGSSVGICCFAGSVGNQCPSGGQFGYSIATITQFCSLTQFCPAGSGYFCVSTSSEADVGVCCTGVLNACTTPGHVPFQSNMMYRSCSSLPGSPACPIGTTCQVSANGIGLCCGAGPPGGGICANGGQSLTVNGMPQMCLQTGTCTQPYTCIGGYCCSVPQQTPQAATTQPPAVCPNGGSFYQGAGFPAMCNVGMSNACPTGYSCLATSSTSHSGYCCASTCPQLAALNGINGAGQVQGILFTDTNNMARQCNAQLEFNGLSQCELGYYCQNFPMYNVGYCCTAGSYVPLNYCPDGALPYAVGNVYQFCSIQIFCPAGYTCVSASADLSVGICCVASSVTCPAGRNALRTGSLVVGCTSQYTTSCPAGFQCNSKAYKGGLCCSVTSIATQQQQQPQSTQMYNSYNYNPFSSYSNPFFGKRRRRR